MKSCDAAKELVVSYGGKSATYTPLKSFWLSVYSVELRGGIATLLSKRLAAHQSLAPTLIRWLHDLASFATF
jgi:hypothetical protein